MDWSAIDFSSGWAICRFEWVIGYHARVVFPEPLDLSRAVAFRRVCPELMNKPLREIKEQCVGLTEFVMEDIEREDERRIRAEMQEKGFDLRLEPILETEDKPFCTLGRGLVLEIEDDDVRRELLACLEEASAPISPAEDRDLYDRFFYGDRDEVIASILKIFSRKSGSPPPPPKLPPFEEREPPHFRYIGESLLRHYVTQDTCAGCNTHAHVFWLLRDLLVEGEEIEAEYVCYDCLRRHEITDLDADRTRNAIATALNAHFPAGSLSGAERERRVDEIFREFMATPKLPNFIQDVDWPSCCGDFTIFVGDAGSTNQGPYDGYDWWGPDEDGAMEHGIEGMMGGEDRVSLYQCPRCQCKYWTFQCT